MSNPSVTMKDHRSLFRQLLAGMYDAVLITDPNGHLLELNPRAKEFFQYEISSVMDKPIGFFIPGVTPEIVQRIRKGLDAARHMMLDANCLRKDGTVFSAEVTVSIIDLMNIGDLVFTIRNTERRRRQLDVYKTKQNAYAIAQSALFACALDGSFRWVNKAFLEMFGFNDEAEVQKLAFAELMSDNPLPELFDKAKAGEATETRITAEEDSDDDSALRTIEIKLAPDMHNSKITGVVGSLIRA